jgi:hypothetical protein
MAYKAKYIALCIIALGVSIVAITVIRFPTGGHVVDKALSFGLLLIASTLILYPIPLAVFTNKTYSSERLGILPSKINISHASSRFLHVIIFPKKFSSNKICVSAAYKNSEVIRNKALYGFKLLVYYELYYRSFLIPIDARIDSVIISLIDKQGQGVDSSADCMGLESSYIWLGGNETEE